MTTNPNRGMILDRDLTPELLDVALRVATDETPWSEKRKLLTVALRDYVSEQESIGKTKKCLTRVWVNPPVGAVDMITWGYNHQQLAADRRLLHLGALLATFPFAGAVTALIGRSLALDGRADPADIRRRACAIWGDRPTVDVGARKVYTTLLRLGVLTGGGRGALLRNKVFHSDSEMAAWLIHALILTRGVESVDAEEVSTAPELFWVKLMNASAHYTLIGRHNEGGRRAIWALNPLYGDPGFIRWIC